MWERVCPQCLDEKHHFNVDGSLKERDLKRMADLKNLTGCKIVRYNEKLNEITEY